MLVSMSSCPYCGNGTNTPCFATYDDGFKCFSCGVFKKADRSFVQKDDKKSSITRLPSMILNPEKWSEVSLMYLYTYHFNNELIKKCKIGEKHPGVLVYPVFDKNELVCYIERTVNPKRVKQHGGKKAVLIDKVLSTTVVLVEDWLSAIRVGEVCPSMCLFGTYCNQKTLAALVRDYETIVIWLDGDEAGKKGADNIQYSLTNEIAKHRAKRCFEDSPKLVKRITTPKDPKAYTDREIADYIFKE